MEEAKKRGAMVLCFGDFFCMMQGKYDPRRSKKDIRPEHNKANYLDAVFDDTAEQVEQYAHLFGVLADGNHETGILKNLEVNPLDNLVIRLKYKAKTNVERMGYHGFIRLRFERETGGKIRSYLLYFHHGKFGGIVTKGVLGVSRHGLVTPQADCIVTGHTHDRWAVPQVRYWLKRNGEVETREQMHVKTGTYKQEFTGSGGWAIERIVAPKSLGGYWMTIHVNDEGLAADFVRTK